MKNLLLVIFTLFISTSVFSGVNLSKTRIVLDSENGYSGNVRVNNHGDEEVLIQAWIDDGNNKVNSKSILVTPPVRRLQEGKSSLVKLRLTGLKETLKLTNLEHVYYLNVKAIPKRNKIDNRLLISTNSRIKVFVRSENLSGKKPVYSDIKKLEVNYDHGIYTIKNNSQFSANFEEIKIDGNSYTGNILLPGDILELNNETLVSFIGITIINDFGAKRNVMLTVNKD